MVKRLLCKLFGHKPPDGKKAIVYYISEGIKTCECPRCHVKLKKKLW